MKKFRKSYPVGYIAAAIFFTIFSVMYLTLCNVVYTNGRQIYRHGYNEALAVYTLRTKTSAISSHVQELRVVAQANYNTNLQREKALQEVTERLEPQVNEDLEEMRAALQDLHNIPDLTEKDLQDINDIDAAVAEFEDAITTILQNGKEVYDSPAIEGNTPDAQRQQAALLKEKAEQNSKLMQNSQENLGIAIGKAMGRWNGMTNMEMGKSRRFHIISDFLMLFIYIVGMAAILIIGNVVRKKEEKLAMKEEEASYQQSKAESANQKTIDIAYKNLVMDCGNKYALLNYVDEVLSSEQEIFVSKLELGDYDAILSMVGLSEMDNYMSVMSNRIKAAYAECGTLFTLSGRDFVFAFNPTITAQQAMEFTEDMKRIIGNIPSALSVQVGSPILSSMAYTGNFKNKNSDSLLTNLHIACLNSRLSGVTVTI